MPRLSASRKSLCTSGEKLLTRKQTLTLQTVHCNWTDQRQKIK
ncbi:MAG: hypothetical protein WC974_09395 [Thermoplasmata archaeon]